MGCGGSKFETEGDEVPVRVRPILRRRIEEIKRRRKTNGLKDPTPSKKELLRNHDDAAAEEDYDNDSSPRHPLHEDDRKNAHPHDSVKVIKVHVEEERSLKPEKEGGKTGEIGKTEEAKSIADSEEGDDDEGEYDEGGYICPASPSFRVYYVQSIADKNDNGDDCNNEGTINESSLGDESIASTKSTEGSVTKNTKKGKRGRRFRRVIHKGGHVAAKNLKSVKSCYNPSASAHDNSRLIQKVHA